MRRTWTLGLLVGVLVGQAAPPPAPAAPAATVRVGTLHAVRALTPPAAEAAVEEWVGRLVYGSLVTLDASGTPVPDLAETWTVEQGGRRWTFRLRPGTRAHDGSPLRVEDVARSLSALHALGWGAGPTARVRVVPPDRVVVDLPEPLGDPRLFDVPLPPPDELAASVPPSRPRGHGPYRVASLDPGRRVRLLRVGSGPGPEEVVVEAFTDGSTLAEALGAGHLDAAFDLEPQQLLELATAPSVIPVVAAGDAVWYVAYRTGGPPLADPALRRALDAAIDRPRLVAEALDGLGEPGAGLLPPAVAAPPPPPPYDPVAAAAALAAAGRPPRLRLLVPDAPEAWVRAAEAVAADWSAAGAAVELQVLPAREVQGRVLAGAYEAVLWGWRAGSSPWFLLDLAAGEGPWADAGPAGDAYRALLAAARAERDPSRREALLQRLQRLLQDEARYSALAYPARLQAYREDRLVGWLRTPPPEGPVLSPYTRAGVLALRPAPQAGGSPRGGQPAARGWPLGAAAAAALVLAGGWWRRRRMARVAS